MLQVPNLDPAAVEDAIIGCAIPEGEQGLNMARIAVLLAGLPNSTGGVTVNRFCASGLTAVQMAADRIRVGEAEVMLAGGAESMSMIPMTGNKPSFNPAIFEKDENIGIAYGMGMTAEKVAAQWKVTREQQDEFALRSHQKAIAAQQAGEFDAEITPVVLKSKKGETQFTKDEHARPETTIEGLAKLPKVFKKDGVIHAGSASGINDGAAALVLASGDYAKKNGEWIVRVCDSAGEVINSVGKPE
jgi:acetyl-CoA acyltransferase